MRLINVKSGRQGDKETRRQKRLSFSLSPLLLILLLLTSCAGGPGTNVEPRAQLSAVQAVSGNGASGFAKVTRPRELVFPRDHGPHQEYATEWWYYTGNLDTADGRHFGFQLTFFRFGLAPDVPRRASDWATTNVYMAHFALTDVAGKQFYAFDRFSRGSAGLAGTTGEPNYRAWLEDWSAEATGAQGLPVRLRAAQDGVAIDLTLDGRKPAVLQGPGGVSQKSATPGNASYYYSFTRMETRGTLTVGGQQLAVTGLSWFDHEFGTSSLEPGTVGWDWFAVQIDDGRDLMYAQVRGANGQPNYRIGTLIAPDGTPQYLTAQDVSVETVASWRSPRSGTTYPAEWRLRVPSQALDLRLTPYLPDQELALQIVYWEGAVKVEGTASGKNVRGNAYVELTGYGEQRGGVRVR